MDLQERQDEEISALQSIFADDFQFVHGQSAWKNVPAVKEFVIRVVPLDLSLRAQVSVKLHVKLPKTYPRSLPIFTLEDVKGLPAAKLPALQAVLKQTAASLQGNEAIFELATLVSNYITEQHSITRPSENVSLIEELDRRAELARQAEAEKNKEAEAQFQHQDRQEREEFARLIESDRQRQLESLKESEGRWTPSNDGANTPVSAGAEAAWRLSLPSGAVTCVLNIGSPFRELSIGFLSHIQLVAESAHAPTSSALLLLIDFSRAKSYYGSASGQRKLASVQDDLTRLERLDSCFIARPYGFRMQAGPVNTALSLDIVLGQFSSTLEDLLGLCGEIQPSKVLPILKDVANGLIQLHGAGITHKRLTLLSIVSCQGHPSFKLVGSSYLQRLFDMNRSVPFAPSIQRATVPDAWQCPEAIYDPLAYDKPRDIWDLGLCTVRMLFGVNALELFEGPEETLPFVKNLKLQRLLMSIFVPVKYRLPAVQVLQQLEAVETSSSHSLTIGSPEPTPISFQAAPTSLPHEVLPFSASPERPSAMFYQPQRQKQSLVAPASRYRSEFEEVEFLGKGGFGSVVKALNKLDKNWYAIKKIKMPNDISAEQKILREVTTWSRLSHPSIVRYHTAWVESETQSLDADKALLEIETSQSNDPTDDDGLRTQSTGEIRSESVDDFSVGLAFDDTDDNDFLSRNGQETSSSYPQIHFGASDDDDDDSDPSERENGNKGQIAQQSARTSRRTSLSRQQKRTLYIQMEFVDGKTLKEATDTGIKDDQAWKLLRQILSAIVSFTSIGIVHRDLKPGNIFLDNLGQVKVGDFGLAVETAFEQNLSASQDRLPSQDSESDLTSGLLGTGLYLAPESVSPSKFLGRQQGANKIDMYSLGVCFFEMVYPINTKMERIKILQALRTPEIRFPDDWDTQRLQKQGQVIRWLLSWNPRDRPTATELLQSDLLPPAVVDEVIEEAIRQIAHNKSPHRLAVLSTLFQPASRDRLTQDFLYDYNTANVVEPYNAMVVDTLKFLFQRRGAVEINSPLLMPFSSLYNSEEGRRPVKLVDESGNILQLPYDLILPLCRQVARDPNLGRLKRYSIGPVFRRREPGGGQPRAPLVASFDIVSSVRTHAAEAEAIHVIDEILDEFPLPASKYIHMLGHTGFLEALLRGIRPEVQKLTLRTLETLNNRGELSSPQKLSAELSKITELDRRVVERMLNVNLLSDLEALRRQSNGDYGFEAALDVLEEIAALCSDLDVKRPLLICPLLVVNNHLHKGRSNVSFFQSVIKTKTGSTTLSVGGRFDNLVEKYAAPDFDRSLLGKVVGVSIAVAQLARAFSQEQEASAKALSLATQGQEKSYGRYAARRCDVYVVSFSHGLLKSRLALCALLWKNNIKADLMYDDDTETDSIEQMTATRRREGILFLVIVKHNQSAYKVRNVLRSGEAEVPRTELIEYLSDSIAEADSARFSTRKRKARKGSLFGKSESGETNRKQLSRTQKLIVAKAEQVMWHRQDTLRQAPIFAVDISGDAFLALADARWVNDSEQYNRLTHQFPHVKTIGTLRQALKDVYRTTSERPLQVWLFSIHQNRTLLVTIE